MTPASNYIDMPSWLEDAWMDRYLERQLTEEESAWFEVYMLSRPHLVARLQLDNDLRDGLAAGADPTAVTSLDRFMQTPSKERPDPEAERRIGTNGPARPTFAMSGFALAASVAAAALIGALTVLRFPPDIKSTSVAIASPPRVVFDTLRGTRGDAVLHAGNPASRYVLIEVSLPTAANGAIYVGTDGRELPVSPGVDGFASVLVPSASLIAAAPPRLRYSINGRVVERVLEADYARLIARP